MYGDNSSQDINHRFDHHPPTSTRAELHAAIRGEVRNLAHQFDEHLPDGREKSLALTKLEEAMFWANAAIARSEYG